jgi:hypothetical protein
VLLAFSCLAMVVLVVEDVVHYGRSPTDPGDPQRNRRAVRHADLRANPGRPAPAALVGLEAPSPAPRESLPLPAASPAARQTVTGRLTQRVASAR